MKRWKRWLLLIMILITAVPALLWTKSGLSMLDRAQRMLIMATNQIYYRSNRPLPSTPKLKKLKSRLVKKGLKLGAPVFLRIFKKEAKLEIWIKDTEQFRHFATYPICYFSGKLGPKQKQGDRQAPEGFYTVSKGQLNPHSRWHRSFNLGYPNLLDRSHKRTGDYLMVHGGCSSIGCYAMTNKVIDEIWTIVTKALNNGQRRFNVHVYPFRMTKWNMRLYRKNKWFPFWRDLKKGYDLFEETKVPPIVSVCKGRYQTRPARRGSNGNYRLSKRCLREARL
jgi:murein L,D-transpeptidase YafK